MYEEEEKQEIVADVVPSVNQQTKVSIEIAISRNFNKVTFGIQDEPILSTTEKEFREGLKQKAKVLREGKDITIVCWSYMVKHSLEAAEILEMDEISAEVIDIRTLIPLDIDTIISSIKKTGKVIITSQEVTQGSFMSEIITCIQESVFDWLDAPIQRFGAPNCIPPSAQNLEKLFLPDTEKLVRIIKENY